MVKVSIEVSSGAARFYVAIQAQSIQRAVSLAQGRYPASNVRVKFPIDPEGFFIEDAAARVGMAELPEKTAA